MSDVSQVLSETVTNPPVSPDLNLRTLLSALEGKDVQLLVPENDVDDPEISIVIPALNEEVTISEFVEWCRTGLVEAGVRGEVLIIDSSTDSTAELALAG